MPTASTSTTSLAELVYFLPPTDGSKPYTHMNADPITGKREKNWTRVKHADIPVENLRGKEDTVTLDIEGFQFFRQPVSYTAFASDEETEKEYYPESVELVKKITGASRVVPFDHSAFPPPSAYASLGSRNL